jgi:hypothetical protein
MLLRTLCDVFEYPRFKTTELDEELSIFMNSAPYAV